MAYLISGYDKDNDIFIDYETVEDFDTALEKFEEYKRPFHENKLQSELGELIDFIAVYDTETNDRVAIEEW